MTLLALPQCDLDWLRRRVANFSEDRPGVYRMLGPDGRVIYVGKAKRVRTRLLSYFRARFPEDKAARILHAADRIEWDYVASEFAALLKELQLIQRFRPVFNVRMNRTRSAVLIKLTAGAAPRLVVGTTPGTPDVRHYGPFRSRRRVTEAVRVLNDLLMLRDCALQTPISFAGQEDLFGTSRAACLRHDLGTCAGPCAGFVSERAYLDRVERAAAFLEGRSIAPLDRVIAAMTEAGDAADFEQAVRWRERFDALEWLFQAVGQTRAAIEALSFVYLDPGAYGDDLVYLIRRATVRAAAPAPTTPLEREAFRAVVEAEMASVDENAPGPVPLDRLEETLLLMRWFNQRPAAMHRTLPIAEWLRHPDRVPGTGQP